MHTAPQRELGAQEPEATFIYSRSQTVGTVLSSDPKKRRKTSMNHSTSMFQHFEVYCSAFVRDSCMPEPVSRSLARAPPENRNRIPPTTKTSFLLRARKQSAQVSCWADPSLDCKQSRVLYIVQRCEKVEEPAYWSSNSSIGCHSSCFCYVVLLLCLFFFLFFLLLFSSYGFIGIPWFGT